MLVKRFFSKIIYCHNWTFTLYFYTPYAFWRESWCFGENYPLIFLTASREYFCSWGKTKSFVYSHGTDHCLKLYCSVLIKYYCLKKASLRDNSSFTFCPCWKSPLLVIGHVFTVSIIRLLGELLGIRSLSLCPFGLFSPSPFLPFLCLPCKLIFQTFFVQLLKLCLELRWSSLHLQMKWWPKNIKMGWISDSNEKNWFAKAIL